jgi:hypothetical protein
MATWTYDAHAPGFVTDLTNPDACAEGGGTYEEVLS